jgi:UDP-glucose 4-epimerase
MVSVDKSGEGLPVAPRPHKVLVTGSAGFIGTALLNYLLSDPSMASVRGIDILESLGGLRGSSNIRADLLAPGLENLLEGAETVVHLAGLADYSDNDSLAERTNVGGTLRLLDACVAAGVRTIVRVIPATIYGAWPTNPPELTENSAVRPVPGFLPAVYAAEVERRLLDWRFDHPDMRVVTLRSAPVLGTKADHMWARVLASPMRLRVRGSALGVQVIHVDDVASAISFAISNELDGIYNLCAVGAISPDSVDELLGRAWIPSLPAELLERLLVRASRMGIGEIPPSIVAYLQYPCLISNKRLLDAGWLPKYTNEDALLEAIDSRPAPDIRVSIASTPAWLKRGALAAGAVVLGSLFISLRRKKK